MSEIEHEDLHEAFVTIVNIVEPTHCYYDGTYEGHFSESDVNSGSPTHMWPMTVDELETSYKQASSSTWASAGPRKYGNHAYLACDKAYFNRVSAERAAAVLVHEVTHISCGSFTDVQSGSHPPRFWELMCAYANRLFSHLDELEAFLGEIDREGFLDECVQDPNSAMVDRRRETVEERREKMRDDLRRSYRRAKCDPSATEQATLMDVAGNSG